MAVGIFGAVIDLSSSVDLRLNLCCGMSIRYAVKENRKGIGASVNGQSVLMTKLDSPHPYSVRPVTWVSRRVPQKGIQYQIYVLISCSTSYRYDYPPVPFEIL